MSVCTFHRFVAINVDNVDADDDCSCVRMMHDEVSDTENIRKNLAIERMIVEGCDILLDTSQTFVRQGELLLHHPLTRRLTSVTFHSLLM